MKSARDRLCWRMEPSAGRIFGSAAALLGLLLTGCVSRGPVATPTLPNGGLDAFYASSVGVGRTPVSGVVFRDSGREIRREMLDLIRGARHSILVGSFLLTDGPASREVLEALVAKSREGVIVRVLGDTSSRFVEEEEAFSFLANAGVPTVEFNPPRIWHLCAPHRLLERDQRLLAKLKA